MWSFGSDLFTTVLPVKGMVEIFGSFVKRVRCWCSVLEFSGTYSISVTKTRGGAGTPIDTYHVLRDTLC